MYKIYLLLCAVNTMAFDSNEEKYIDLLPEAEKQEFLNRIARRILEEIQSKESPEQAQADVTDDQLAAHDAYVQDLLKQESENHRNEKRDISKRKENEDDKRKYSPTDKQNDTENVPYNEDRHHIDLTLRAEGKDQKDQSRGDPGQEGMNKETNSFSVIPVKVVYDQQNVNKAQKLSTVSPNNPTSVSGNSEQINGSFVPNSSERDDNGSKEGKTNNKNEEPDKSSRIIPISEEREILTGSKTNMELQVTTVKNVIQENFNNDNFSAENDTKSEISNEKKSNVDIKKSDYENFDEPVTVPYDPNITDNNAKHNDGLQGPNIDMNNNNQEVEKTTESDVISNEETTLLPLTTVIGIETRTKKLDALNNENDRPQTMPHNTKPIDKPKNEKEGNKSVGENMNEGLVNYKKYLRKRYETITEEYYSVENIESNKNNIQEKQPKNKELKQHFVYEVSPKNPPFVKKNDLKESEQPYYVPIYNFAPVNAFYNAYNNFGPSVHEDLKRTERISAHNNEELDRNLYKIGGYEIDMHPQSKHRGYSNDKFGQNHFSLPNINQGSYKMKQNIPNPYHSNFDMNYYDYDDTAVLRQPQYGNFDETVTERADTQYNNIFREKHKPDFAMDYFTGRSNGKRRWSEKTFQYHGGHFPDSNEEDHPYNSMYKDDVNSHVQAVKKLLYRKKEFGFLSPTPHLVDTEHRDNTVRRDERKKMFRPYTYNINNISMDYYWGPFANAKTVDLADLDPVKTKIKHKTGYKQNLKPKVPKAITRNSHSLGDGFEENMQVSLEAATNVLKDMIQRDRADLISYDWLKSTVDIIGALNKLLELINKAESDTHIDPLDLKLLIDIIYLYDTSNQIINEKSSSKEPKQLTRKNINVDTREIMDNIAFYLRRIRKLPRGKFRKPGDKIKDPLSLWKAWYRYYIRILDKEDARNVQTIKNFKQFLVDVQDNLYDFHNAIKHIAMIMTHAKQTWYKDLKNVFLKSATKKKLLQVILHLSTAKLFNNIEKNTKNTGNIDPDATKALLEDFILVLRILERLKKNIY